MPQEQSMKDGDRFIELVNRRNALRYLWELFTYSSWLQRDYFDWLDYCRTNKN